MSARMHGPGRNPRSRRATRRRTPPPPATPATEPTPAAAPAAGPGALAPLALAPPSHAVPPPPEQRPDGPWNEADSFRETTLHHIEDPRHRAALREVGRMLYEMALETKEGRSNESDTRADLRAALADLRYLAGYLAMIRLTSETASLPPSDHSLARFAGRIGRRVAALAEAIETRMS